MFFNRVNKRATIKPETITEYENISYCVRESKTSENDRCDSKIHHRRSIRLNGYDYSQCGAYFITICAQNRECLFGKIIGDKMQLNDAGRMMQKWWLELSNKFPHPISIALFKFKQGAHAGAPLL